MEVKVKTEKSQPENDQLSAKKVKNPEWLNPEHPNYERWERGRELSSERGNFVRSILEKYILCKSLSVLDLGSGEGGTSSVFSKFNYVYSYDINMLRLERQKNSGYFKINGDSKLLPFKNKSFNLIILQDVIEHFSNILDLVSEIRRVLKPEGIIYVSTPNKFSIINFFADPHWGFPVVSLLKREAIKKYFLKNFRNNELNRNDISQLLSYKDIENYFGNSFRIHLEIKTSVRKLIAGDKGIIWSNFHLYLIRVIKKLGIEKLILLLANNKPQFINNFITPTFYLVMQKIK